MKRYLMLISGCILIMGSGCMLGYFSFSWWQLLLIVPVIVGVDLLVRRDRS